MNLVLLGPPGSGKGTQARHIEKNYGIKSISTGDLLRNEIKKKPEIGKKLKDIMGKGYLVDDQMVLDLLKINLMKSEYSTGFILDGYPRNLNQVNALEVLLKDLGKKIDKVLYFFIDETILVDRICNRYYCTYCKTNYNKLYKNTKVEGVCDNCGSVDLQVRKDDKFEVVKKRFKEYKEQTFPLVEHYKAIGVLNEFDASKDIDLISKEIDLIIKKTLT